MNVDKLYETDREFMERFEYFAFNEVVNEKDQTLDEETRCLAILVLLILKKAYVGFSKMLPFLEIVNEELSSRVNVALKEKMYQSYDYGAFG